VGPTSEEIRPEYRLQVMAGVSGDAPKEAFLKISDKKCEPLAGFAVLFPVLEKILKFLLQNGKETTIILSPIVIGADGSHKK
jgi:hypothetical protein